jgi:seryl-tRNA synthetase
MSSDTAAAAQGYLGELIDAGLLIPLGASGLYGRSGLFERIVEHFERYVTRLGSHLAPEVMRFPPLISRDTYLKTDHIQNFPDLMGSVHTFTGGDRDHIALLRKKEEGGEWDRDLAAAEVMLCPAACYPLYPTAKGELPPDGRIVDLQTFVFRHEPSLDPFRMQMFRQREYVRLGSGRQALAHRDYWLERAESMLREVGLDVQPVLANDPFFGRGGRVMASAQQEQTLKYELVIQVSDTGKPTAIASCNYHLDHFGHAFDIRTPDGAAAHSACVGFGLERITLALFRVHGFAPERWPASVRRALEV